MTSAHTSIPASPIGPFFVGASSLAPVRVLGSFAEACDVAARLATTDELASVVDDYGAIVFVAFKRAPLAPSALDASEYADGFASALVNAPAEVST